MRCLVTGVAGFIGSHLAERLLQDGHEVCGIDALIGSYPRDTRENNLEVLKSWKHFSFVDGDLLHVSLPPLVEGVHWIFHQAARTGARADWKKAFATYVDCNIIGTQLFLETVLQYGGNVQRFVYASSSSVYGNSSVLPVTEALVPRPVSPYC